MLLQECDWQSNFKHLKLSANLMGEQSDAHFSNGEAEAAVKSRVHKNYVRPFCADPFDWHKEKHRTIRPKGRSLCSISNAKVDQVNAALFPAESRLRYGDMWCGQCRLAARQRLQTSISAVGFDSTNQISVIDVSDKPFIDENELDNHIESLYRLLGINSNYNPTTRSVALRDRFRADALMRIAKVFRPDLKVQLSEDDDRVASSEQALSWLLDRIDKSYSTANYAARKQLLALVPPQFTYEDLRGRFGCSNYLISAVRQFQLENDLLQPPPAKSGRRIPETVVERVESFYLMEDHSRHSSNSKDVMECSDGEQPKRWLRYNIDELFYMFVEANPDVKISRSSFFYLRPANCVTMGSKASHNVCVCVHHQNVKLLLEALPDSTNYKSLLAESVCDMQKIHCMLGKCENCLGIVIVLENLRKSLPNSLLSVTFRQWAMTGERTNILTRVESLDDYFSELQERLQSLREHHFTAVHQKEWIKEKISNLVDGELSAKVDFAQNFVHICQDEVQSHYWNATQSTLHPISIRFRKNGEVQFRSLCVISDCLQHNTTTVQAIIRLFNKYLDEDEDLKKIQKILYISDGCAGQYKNKKNFFNLTMHEHDFGRSAEWIFQATAHGKCECDGIGAAAKCRARKASLHGRTIQSPYELFEFLSATSSKVTYLWLPATNVDAITDDMEKRFAEAEPIRNCRSYHHFVPIGIGRLHCFRFAGHEEDSFISGIPVYINYSALRVGLFVAIVYDSKWYLAKIIEIAAEDRQNREVCVSSFLQHNGANSFSWPKRPDICHVMDTNILCSFADPVYVVRGRQSVYVIKESEYSNVEKIHQRWLIAHSVSH